MVDIEKVKIGDTIYKAELSAGTVEAYIVTRINISISKSSKIAYFEFLENNRYAGQLSNNDNLFLTEEKAIRYIRDGYQERIKLLLKNMVDRLKPEGDENGEA